MTTLIIADMSEDLQAKLRRREEELREQGKHLLQLGKWPESTLKRKGTKEKGDV